MSIDNFWMAEREYNPEEAYFNKADGLFYCVDCKTPVEAYFAEKEKVSTLVCVSVGVKNMNGEKRNVRQGNTLI